MRPLRDVSSLFSLFALTTTPFVLLLLFSPGPASTSPIQQRVSAEAAEDVGNGLLQALAERQGEGDEGAVPLGHAPGHALAPRAKRSYGSDANLFGSKGGGNYGGLFGSKRTGAKGFHEGIFDEGFGGFTTLKKRKPEMTSRGIHGDAFTGGFGDFYTMKKRSPASPASPALEVDIKRLLRDYLTEATSAEAHSP